MKAVQLLVNSHLPDDLKNYDQTYDVKSLNKILNAVAKRHPDKYADITKKISDIGRTASWYQGETISLADLAPVIDRKSIYAKMDEEIAALPKDKDYKTNRLNIFQKYNNLIEKETATAALKSRNNIAMAVLSGARGKNAQLKAMISTPGTYSDYKDNPIDLFSRESFAEGIRPATFLASTFGSRSSIISTKVSTAKGGDWAKQAAAVAADLVIRKDDCNSDNGISLATDDNSLKGRFLARPAAGMPAGTLLDRDALAKLRNSQDKNVIVRSATTCNVADGLCAKCVGRFFNGGKMPKVGDAIGQLATSTIGEPITQMALCLSEETLVKVEDGYLRKIKHFKVGDTVLASDKDGQVKEVKVLNVWDQGEKLIHDFVFYDTYRKREYRVSATRDHKVLVNTEKTERCEGCANSFACGPKCRITGCRSIKPIAEITEHDQVMISTDEHSGYTLAKLSWTSLPYTKHCYDLEVDHPDHLFVLGNGMIVSNSSKHTAGMTKDKKSYSGLEYIQQFSQSPETFKDRAPVSELDGTVEDVHEAAQGGTYIIVDGKKHYVAPGHAVMVKPGDNVEAGDQLADGLIDPEDVVKYKGLGAGRVYYAERFNQILADSGAGTDKRNTEIFARASLRHVKINDPDGMGSYLPDDLVDYNAVQASYTPPETSQTLKPTAAVGKYLQAPVLHYTIGTRITPSVAKTLAENKYDNVLADDKQPQFEPQMVRLRAASHSNPDWLASLGTSYLSKQLNDAATRGDDTNVAENTDYRPRLAIGVGFGKNVQETGKF